MPTFFSISTAVINTIPLDLEYNTNLICKCINEASEKKSNLLLFPELSITGYGCEDEFYVQSFINLVPLYVEKIIKTIPDNMVVAVGLPILYNGQLFNSSALLGKNKIYGFVCKQFLARTGIHYENRWFTPWPKNTVSEIKNWLPAISYNIPIGDLIFEIDGVKIGFEICEDSWVANRPGNHLCSRNVDIILNPSASHFAIGKQEIRRNFVKDGSRAFCCVYAYTNLLGNEAGRAIYDGDSIIASDGKIVLNAERLSFKESIVYNAIVDLSSNRNNRLISSENYILSQNNIGNVVVSNIKFDLANLHFNGSKQILDLENEHEVACRAVALGMWDFMRKTSTSGFALSLSGGADSALCAAMVYYGQVQAAYSLGIEKYTEIINKCRLNIPKYDHLQSIKDYIKKYVMNEILVTLYQGSEHSGNVTYTAANELANSIGAKHFSWKISTIVKEFEKLVNEVLPDSPLSWEKDDLALQNIQARTRSPGIWLIANKFNKLLIATSNLSEASVGYCTMDGDTSGVLSPIGGISKSRILKIIKYIMEQGLLLQDSNDEILQIPAMKYIVEQKPTAELRPIEQTDESDLMPYPLLDEIRRLTHTLNLWPKDVLTYLLDSDFGKTYSRDYLINSVKKFFRLWCRNQWKRERIAVSFHIELDSADPKTYRRFPVLSNQFIKQLEEL